MNEKETSDSQIRNGPKPTAQRNMAVNRGGWSRLTRPLLYSAIVFLTLGSLYAIFIVLAGQFGDFEAKVLATTFIIGGASVGWLCCGSYSHGRREPIGGTVGTIVIGTAVSMLVSGIWAEIESEGYWQTTLVLCVWAMGGAHFMILMAIRLRGGQMWLQVVAGILDALLAFMISVVIVAEDLSGEGIWKSIAVLGILAALATVVIMILSALVRKTRKLEQSAARAALTLTGQEDGIFSDAEGRRYVVEEI